MKDFYYILGTDITCTSVEIREAYKKLSKKFHPEVNEHDPYLESHFKDISEAYEILSDPVKRSKYDAAFKKNQYKQLYYFKTKPVNIAFSIMLILITLLFGYYVVKSISGSKTPQVNTYIAATPTVKHHKKKHRSKIKTSEPQKVPKIVSIPPRVMADTTKIRSVQKIHPAQPAPIKETPVKIAGYTHVDNTVNLNKAPINNTINNPIDYLYVAYIKANATGVVYLRGEDNYAADVVKVIPGNSKVFVLAKGDAFYKVMFDNKTGYVPKWTIQTQ